MRSHEHRFKNVYGNLDRCWCGTRRKTNCQGKEVRWMALWKRTRTRCWGTDNCNTRTRAHPHWESSYHDVREPDFPQHVRDDSPLSNLSKTGVGLINAIMCESWTCTHCGHRTKSFVEASRDMMEATAPWLTHAKPGIRTPLTLSGATS